MTDSLIPRRIAFRLAACVLADEAFRLRSLADPRRHGRPGRASAALFAQDHAAGRKDMAAEWERDAQELRRLAPGGKGTREADGPGVDAAVLGHLLACLLGRFESYPELRAELRDWLGRECLPEKIGDVKLRGEWGPRGGLALLVLTVNDGPPPAADLDIED